MEAVRFDTVDDPDAGVVICFGGRSADETAWSPFHFLAQVEDRDFNVLHVRDVYHRWYQHGVPGLGNTADEVAASLRRMLAPYKGRRLITIGHSMGAYGAILFGLLLGANKIIAMGPQTFIGPDLRAANHDDRWPSQMVRIHPKRMAYPDLVPLMKANNGTHISIFHTTGNELDTLHVNRVADMPHVTIFAMDTDKPNIAAALRNFGALRNVVECELHGHPLPPPFAEDTGPTWRLDVHPGSRKAIVVFGSRGRGFGAFELSSTFKEKHCTMLYVRDPLDGWYNLPIRDVGRNIGEIAAWIKRKLDEQGIEDVRTIGGSMGGFGAILFGSLLNVTSVLTFAPQTFIDPVLRAKHDDDRWEENMARIGRPTCGDLLPLLEENERRARPTRIVAHYSAEVPIDKLHVERIAHLPSVVAKPHMSKRHNIARELQRKREFGPAIVEALELERL